MMTQDVNEAIGERSISHMAFCVCENESDLLLLTNKLKIQSYIVMDKVRVRGVWENQISILTT